MAGSALALGACGSSSNSETSTTPTTAAGPAASSLNGKKVALVACGDQNQWCKTYNHVVIDGLRSKGVDVNYLQDPFDAVQQVQHLNQAIAQKPDRILLVASDARAIIPALRKAKAAGIPVTNLVGPAVAESQPYFDGRIEANMEQLGVNAGKALIEGMQKQGFKKGNVIAITGTTGQGEVAARMKGFKAQLAAHPEYKLVEVQDGSWDQVKSAKIAQQLFAKYRNKGGIQGALGMADPQAAGIIQAAQQTGLPVRVGTKDGLVVVGSTCFKIGMDNIAKGTQYGTSTQAAVPLADFTLPLLQKQLAGEDIPNPSMETEEVITKANLAKWRGPCSAA